MAILLSDVILKAQQRSAPEGAPAGDRAFLSIDEIKQAITRSKNYELDGTSPALASVLLLFDTRMQRTWLAKTGRRLYCILDDLRKSAPHINWSMAMSEVVKDGKVILEIRVHDMSETGKSGLVDFGPNHKDWIFSTRLFTVRPVEEEIRAFLLK
jgi:hypothetical protein